MSSFLKKQKGSVMMEYIIITSVFMLGIGGLVYMESGFVNLLGGLLPGGLHSSFTIAEKNPGEYMTYIPVEQGSITIEKYGVVGDAFAAQSQRAQKVIAMPQL